MPQSHFNRAAGFRRLGARKHARQLNHQVEAATSMDAVQDALRDAVTLLVETYAKAGHARSELVEANRIATSSEYEAPSVGSMEVAVA